MGTLTGALVEFAHTGRFARCFVLPSPFKMDFQEENVGLYLPEEARKWISSPLESPERNVSLLTMFVLS